MNDSVAKSLEEAHGFEFLHYCLEKKIRIRKDENNCFVLPGQDSMTLYLQFIHSNRKRFDFRLKRLLNSRRRRRFNPSTSESDAVNESDENILSNLSSVSVCLYCSSSVLPMYKTPLFQSMLGEKNGTELYESIIKDTEKDIVIIDYENTIPLISSHLETLKKRHQKFHYTSVLRHIAFKKEFPKNPACEYAFSRYQVIHFLELIFSKVVPLRMFGKLRNLKKIKYTMMRLLDLPYFERFDLKDLVLKLDISSIEWLRDIDDVKTKLLILLKVVKWFFCGFMFRLLYLHFHIVMRDNSRLFIPWYKWNKIQTHFIKKSVRTNRLKLIKNEFSLFCPTGTYNLVPKFSTVRPILKSDKSKKFNNQKVLMMNFLKQLYVTEYGIDNFLDDWKSVTQSYRNTKAYMVYCDITDAFGSIIQELLLEVIKELSKNLPDSLVFKMYYVKSSLRGATSTCYKQYCCHPDLKLPFAPGKFYVESRRHLLIKKSTLLEDISKCIFEQTVNIKGKMYALGKGVAQGAPLSCILSALYYSYILNEELRVFLKHGKLLKYVDDIIYVTNNEDFARRFIEVTKRGLSRYNCYFKQEKTRSNVYPEVKNIHYIGYKIDCRSLELTSDYTNRKFIYRTYAKKAETPLQILKRRLKNLAGLKLAKIIVPNEINSQSTVIKILDESFSVQAERARHLLIRLFGNKMQKNVPPIFDIIRYTNEMIARSVIKSMHKSQELTPNEMLIWNRHIMTSIWSSYIDVFKKVKILRECFIKSFQQAKRNSACRYY